MKELDGKPLEVWMEQIPLLADLAAMRPVFWENPEKVSCKTALFSGAFSPEDVADASARLERFAPCLARLFPETASSGGIIESPLHPAPRLLAAMQPELSRPVHGRLFIKLDSHLPVSGSIKSRGGVHEVLRFAETLALQHGFVSSDQDYSVLAEEDARNFFGQYSLAVGSTGNLGLSIGMSGSRLGFKVSVHMSADARQWKKDKLRANGVTVVEHADDYSAAVAAGRNAARQDATCHFVDDEDSRDLFLGYAVAGERIAAQLRGENIQVDADHPLYVYLPCGVGGGPGGVTYGLKLQFGDAVTTYFAEPAQAPAVILGLLTGLDERIHCRDLGLDGLSAADGLAVGQPSGLVCRAMRAMLDGCFTVREETLFRLLALVAEHEGIQLEPSAVAGIPGIDHVLRRNSAATSANATHIIWATGGSMVPDDEWNTYRLRGLQG